MNIPSANTEGKTDKAIWALLRKGNEEALSLLVLRYYDDLIRYGSSLCKKTTVVEDVIQDIFCELWQKRQTLSEVSFIKSYLFTALRNRIFRQMELEKRIVSKGEAEDFYFEAEFSPEELLIHKNDAVACSNKLNNFINELSPRQREAIYLRFYEGLDYNAIAKIMNITVPYLYLLIHKSIERLKLLLKKKQATP